MAESQPYWLTELVQQPLPTWQELPQVPLYMNQTLVFVNDTLRVFDLDEITAGMINNYVKHQLVLPPENRKYGRDQIACILVISFFKSAYSLTFIRRSIDLFLRVSTPESGYNSFVTLVNRHLQQLAANEMLPLTAYHLVERPTDELIQVTAIRAVFHQIMTRKLVVFREEFSNDPE